MAEGQGDDHTGVRKYFFSTKESVSSDWKDLAFHLGLERADIDNIAGRNRDDKSRCMDLLEEWLKRNGERATMEVMMEALSAAKLQSTVDRLKKRYPEWDRPQPSSSKQERKEGEDQLPAKKGEDIPIESVFKASVRRYYDLKLTKFKPLIWNDNFTLSLADVFTELEFIRTREKGHRPAAEIERLDDLLNPNVTVPSTALRCILIEAEPGGGKTTFMSKEAMDAVSQKTELGKRYDIVLLIRLREVREGETIEEMVWDQCVPETTEGVDVQSIRAILQRNESSLLFLLDGYDELRSEARAAGQAIPKLLSGKLYPNSTIVITSRRLHASAGVEKHTQPDCHARITGLSFERMEKFVGQYFTSVDKQDLAKPLTSYLDDLDDNDLLGGLVQTPIFLMVVCLLWEEDQAMVTAGTMTGLYDNLLTCLVKKHCKREGVNMPTDGMPEDLASALLQLGKLALEALLKKETQLDLAEAERQNLNWGLLLKLGVVFAEESASKLHPRKQLTFAHKTMQEFLAGRYAASVVVNQDIGELRKLTSISDVLEHRSLLKFTCGCGSRAAQAVMEWLASISSKEYEGLEVQQVTKLDWPWMPLKDPVVHKPFDTRTYKDFVYLCLDILNERQEPGVLQAVNRALPFIVSHNVINSRQHAALKYYVKNIQSSSHPVKMALEIGGPAHYVIFQGLQFLEHTFPSPTPGLLLDLSLTGVFVCSAILTEGLVSILKRVPGLRALDMSETRQSAASLRPIVQAFRHMSKLEELDLSLNELGNDEIDVLQEGLKSLPQLAVLHLRANIYQQITITATGMSRLAPSMCKLTKLRELDISCNKIGDTGMKRLAYVLRLLTSMQILVLAQIGISITGMRKLVRALRNRTGLLKLDISGNHIGDTGLGCLVDILPRLTAMKVLELSKTCISDKGMSALVRNLLYLAELQVLDVSHNAIGDSGIVNLVQTLNCRASSLQDLNFRENSGVTAAGLERVSQVIALPSLIRLGMCAYPDRETLIHLPDTAAMAVAQALARLPALERIDLCYISMDPAGFQAVVQAAEEQPCKLWYTKEGVPEGAERYRWQNSERLDNIDMVAVMEEAAAMFADVY
ncbi:PREDICTED: NLR family CARD domain-containing protein 4-like [Branchiostoma belcheri]|uniref:NLR family CARD domain-containing protein 4-like n=1 Tax=Branchiostoma belcheri TaxID=7741 RepID=A0A6P4YD26_BRABE|nr:PREDICTED: NLR family CARD domain-containing protein 4-like [Branchiostoma belcheri]